MSQKTVENFVKVVLNLIEEKMAGIDRVVSCNIVQVNYDQTVNITLTSDPSVTLTSIRNEARSDFVPGDQAYLLLIGGQLSNAFVVAKQKNN